MAWSWLYVGHSNARADLDKGYDADHPNIDLLRLKNFTMGKKLEDKDITSADFLNRVASLVETMVPFVSRPLPCHATFLFVEEAAPAYSTNLQDLDT